MLAANEGNAQEVPGDSAPQMQSWLAEATKDGGPTDPHIWTPESQGQAGPVEPPNTGPSGGETPPQGTGTGDLGILPPPLRKYLERKTNDGCTCVRAKILKFAAEISAEDLDAGQQGLRDVAECSTHVPACSYLNNFPPEQREYLEEYGGSTYTSLSECLSRQNL